MEPILRLAVLILLIYVGLAASTDLEMTAHLMDKTPSKPIAQQTIDGVTISDDRTFKALRLEVTRDKYCPWMRDVKPWMTVLLLSIAVGYWGGFARDYYDYFRTNRQQLNNNAWIGLIIGPSLIGVLYVIPNTMLVGQWEYKTLPLIGFLFIACFFSELTFEWLKKHADETVFKNERSPTTTGANQ